MDILNWLYLAKNKFVRTTIDNPKDLMIFGAKVGFDKRGDLYQNYAMSVEDFAASLPSALPYQSTVGVISQKTTNPPAFDTANHYNGLGGTWVGTYNAVGNYVITNSSLSWDPTKVAIFYTTKESAALSAHCRFYPNTSGSNASIEIYTMNSANPGVATDSLLYGFLEIRLYN